MKQVVSARPDPLAGFKGGLLLREGRGKEGREGQGREELRREGRGSGKGWKGKGIGRGGKEGWEEEGGKEAKGKGETVRAAFR